MPEPLADVSLELPAAAEHVGTIRDAVARVAVVAGLDAARLADVALAVGEACANVVVHAYVGREPGRLTVRADAGRGLLVVVVGDDGNGMAPRPDSPGLGLGLPLMASLATTMEMREGPRGGTEIWMAFDAHSEPDADWARTG